MDFVAGPV